MSVERPVPSRPVVYVHSHEMFLIFQTEIVHFGGFWQGCGLSIEAVSGRCNASPRTRLRLSLKCLGLASISKQNASVLAKASGFSALVSPRPRLRRPHVTDVIVQAGG